MTQLVIALSLMLATVGAAGRWASIKQRRLRSAASPDPSHGSEA